MKKTILLVTLAILDLYTADAQVGIGTNDPDPSAILEIDVTSLTTKKGFLPPRMSETERDNNITNSATNPPAVGLTIYNTTTNCIEFWGGYGWTSLCANVEAGDVLNSQTGKIWMDKDLGANQVPATGSDFEGYGHFFQWGRPADDHEVINWISSSASDGTEQSNETTTLSSLPQPATSAFITIAGNWYSGTTPAPNTLWLENDKGTNDPCPSGYRIPTEAEFATELSTWDTQDASGAFSSELKLPVAGDRIDNTGSLNLQNIAGFYWTSTIGGNNTRARYMNFNSNANSAGVKGPINKAFGFSIRCIKDE